MVSKAEMQGSSIDTVKLAAALLLVSGAIIAFYYYAEVSLLVRVLGLLSAVIAAVAVSWHTDRGRQIAGFLKDAQIEVRKVVWPNRQETVQTTLVVLLIVVIVAVVLMGLDGVLAWIIGFVTGTRS